MSGDFDKVISLAKEKMALVASNIKKLEEKGLIRKDRSHRVEQIKLEELKKIELQSTQAKKIEEIKPVAKKEIQLGIVQRIYAFIVDGIAKVYNFFKNLFSGKIAVQKSVQPNQPSSIELSPTGTSSKEASSQSVEAKQKQTDTVSADSVAKISTEKLSDTSMGMPAPDELTMPMP